MARVQVNIPVEPELKNRLKRYCYENDKRQKRVVELAIDEYLTKHGYEKEQEEK